MTLLLYSKTIETNQLPQTNLLRNRGDRIHERSVVRPESRILFPQVHQRLLLDVGQVPDLSVQALRARSRLHSPLVGGFVVGGLPRGTVETIQYNLMLNKKQTSTTIHYQNTLLHKMNKFERFETFITILRIQNSHFWWNRNNFTRKWAQINF